MLVHFCASIVPNLTTDAPGERGGKSCISVLDSGSQWYCEAS
jgi:hypothetical protein